VNKVAELTTIQVRSTQGNGNQFPYGRTHEKTDTLSLVGGGSNALTAEDNPSDGRSKPLPYNKIEEKCRCIECYDEDSGKYKYWVGEPELMKYFGNAEYGVRGAE
jgi:hypothetical protein